MSHYRRLPRIAWRSRAARRRETDEEIDTHLQMRIDDLVLMGFSPEEARERALERFGDLSEAKARIEAAARKRDLRLGWSVWIDGLRRDLVVAARRVRSRPGSALLRVSIFGLGIGLTTAMYSLVDRVLLRPLPFPDSDRLVALSSVSEEGHAFPWVSMGNWYDWRAANRTLESTALYSSYARSMTVSIGDGAFTAPGVRVSGAFFETLRPTLIAGVAPTESVAQEDRSVVVVSEGFWRRVLGADPVLDGRTIVVDGRRLDVVAVVASGYDHPEGVDLWIPRAYRPETGGARNNINYFAIARLAPEATREQAADDLSTIATGIRSRDPAGIYSWGVVVDPLHDLIIGPAGAYLGLLMGAVSLVLLVACANLAALGFARGSERADEVAMRRSLGASRGRVARQLLTEDLALALAGGLVGLGLAWAGTGVLFDRIADVVPRLETGTFDGRVLVAGLVFSLLAGTIAGLPPALRVSKRGGGGLFASTRTARGGRSFPGSLLVGAEVALTVLLLSASGLLLMSLQAVTSRDLGFDPTGVATLDVTLVSPEYVGDEDRVLAYWDAVRAELGSSPQVESVALSSAIPTGVGATSFIDVADQPDRRAGASYRIVSEAYFEVLRMPLVRGRAVGSEDRLGGEPVAVVNQAMADELWPSENPVGKRVRASSMEDPWFEGETPWRTVVGVVGSIRDGGFESDVRPTIYVPQRQMPWMTRSMTAVVRARNGEAATLARDARARVEALDRSLAVEVSTLDRRLGGRLRERKLIAGLLAAFAVAALGLAALGVYSVLSFAIRRRSREMAIRRALGAQQGRIVRLVLGGALRVVLIGTGIGLALALVARRILDSLLVDVSSLDPIAYLGAGTFLLLVVLGAAGVPARRASRLDPLEALRRP